MHRSYTPLTEIHTNRRQLTQHVYHSKGTLSLDLPTKKTPLQRLTLDLDRQPDVIAHLGEECTDISDTHN